MTSSEGLPSNRSSRSVTLLVKPILKTNSSYSNEQTIQLSVTRCQRAFCGSNRKPHRMFMDIPSPFPYKATVGIDWADQKHDVFVRFAKGDSYRRKIDSRPEAIQEWLLELRSACAEERSPLLLNNVVGLCFTSYAPI